MEIVLLVETRQLKKGLDSLLLLNEQKVTVGSERCHHLAQSRVS